MGARPGAFLTDTRGDVAHGIFRMTLQRGHQALHLSHRHGHHEPHPRCAEKARARGATPAPAPVRRPEVN